MKEVANNYFVQATGKTLSIIIGFLSVAILARTLGKTGFGEYTTAMTFLNLFGVFVDFGLTLTLVQMIVPATADEKHIVGNFLGLRLVSGFVFFSLAPAAVLLFPYPAAVKLGVAVGAMAFLFMSASGMLVGVFQKHLAMWRFALAELVNRALYLGLVALLALYGFGMVSMIAAMIIANAVWLWVTIALARRYVEIRPQFNLQVWKESLSRSWPIALSVMFNLVYLRGDIIILASYRTQAEVGLYGVAYKIIDVLTNVPVMFMGLMLPMLTRVWSERNLDQFREYLQKSFDFLLILVLPMAVGAQAVAAGIVEVVAGPGFEPAATILQILMLAMVGVFVNSLYGHAVVALHKQRAMIWGYAVTAVVTLAGYLVFVPRFGMYGAAWMTVFSEFLIAILTFSVVAGASRALPTLVVAAKALAASAVMYVVLAVMPDTHVLIDVAVGALVYAATIVGFGGVKLATLRDFIPRRIAG